MNKLCNKNMTFEECELVILRSAVDKAEHIVRKTAINSPDINKILVIVENFIKKKSLVCYGGTAINNILPKQDQFYDKDIEIPDYDFFSPNALNDAKELTDLYFKSGFKEVEAKSGMHHGTYKVFVNFIPIADITFLHRDLYKSIKKESIRVAGILYAPPNYLRMSMYLELSRPVGDISRWEKILKRLTLLNKHYPLKSEKCQDQDFQREMMEDKFESEIYDNVKNTLVNQSVVFFGGYAMSMYAKYMPKDLHNQVKKIPDFDVISEDAYVTAEIVVERLKDININNARIIKNPEIGDVIPTNYQILIGKDTIAFVYEPIACHSYNIISVKGQQIKIATIDTMLSYYLAFLYSGKKYYDTDRILCMANYLFEVQEKNRLEQKGLLKRFSVTCYGHQKTVAEVRSEKAEKFRELKVNRNSKEFEEWFLSYRPADSKNPAKKQIATKKQNPRNKTSKTKNYKSRRNIEDHQYIKKIFGKNYKKYKNKTKKRKKNDDFFL